MGGTVARWLVRWTLDRAAWVLVLAGVIVLCSWAPPSTGSRREKFDHEICAFDLHVFACVIALFNLFVYLPVFSYSPQREISRFLVIAQDGCCNQRFLLGRKFITAV